MAGKQMGIKTFLKPVRERNVTSETNDTPQEDTVEKIPTIVQSKTKLDSSEPFHPDKEFKFPEGYVW